MIGAVGFHRNVKNPSCEIFTITLDEIDRIIEDKQRSAEDQASEELVDAMLPKQYQEQRDAFSKAASDILPPHRDCDHKIELVGENSLRYSPLYKYMIEELEAIKKYLFKNLNKGFIILENAPFIAPILFARKSDGGLRFCVDYRKLNAITKKDRYPLPLIDETLARLSRAKIFTKIDIALIGAVRFYYNVKNPSCEIFTITLDEIDQIIEDK